jgi:hypothetical protein
MWHVLNFGITEINKHGLRRLLYEHYSINVYITLVITHEPPYLTEGWAAQTSGVLTCHQSDIPKTSYKNFNYKYTQRQGWQSLLLMQTHTPINTKVKFPFMFPCKMNFNLLMTEDPECESKMNVSIHKTQSFIGRVATLKIKAEGSPDILSPLTNWFSHPFWIILSTVNCNGWNKKLYIIQVVIPEFTWKG